MPLNASNSTALATDWIHRNLKQKRDIDLAVGFFCAALRIGSIETFSLRKVLQVGQFCSPNRL